MTAEDMRCDACRVECALLMEYGADGEVAMASHQAISAKMLRLLYGIDQ